MHAVDMLGVCNPCALLAWACCCQAAPEGHAAVHTLHHKGKRGASQMKPVCQGFGGGGVLGNMHAWCDVSSNPCTHPTMHALSLAFALLPPLFRLPGPCLQGHPCRSRDRMQLAGPQCPGSPATACSCSSRGTGGTLPLWTMCGGDPGGAGGE